eukprot:1835031-Ditylum_brightwellii.AAC.1
MSILHFCKTTEARYANDSRKPLQYNTYRIFGNKIKTASISSSNIFTIKSVIPTASPSVLWAYFHDYNKNISIFTIKSRTMYHQVNLTLTDQRLFSKTRSS